MWGKIIIPMYKLWLHGLYGLYGPRCPLFLKRPINLISLSPEKMQMGKKLCYLLGDYDINLFNYGSHNLTSEFIYMMYSFSYAPLINCPTRITKNSASLINYIFTNNYNVLDKSMQAILLTDISDHLPIIHFNWNYSEGNHELSIVKICYSAKNRAKFKEAVRW